MSDPFFQKKRKRTGTSGSGSGGGGSSRSRGGEGGFGDNKSKAGPSRLRMREKGSREAGRSKNQNDTNGFKSKRIGGGGKDQNGDQDEDDEDEADEGGIEGMNLSHRYEDDLHSSDEDEIDETPAEARIRLAKLYLESLKSNDQNDSIEGIDEIDAAKVDRENISARLQRDAATHSTHIHDFVADRIILPPKGDNSNTLACRGHRLSVTTASFSHDCSTFWTAGKDGRIIRWRLRDGKMLEMISRSSENGDLVKSRMNGNKKHSKSSGAARRRARLQTALTRSNGDEVQDKVDDNEKHCQVLVPEKGKGHTDEIWTLAVSQDGKFLATGGKDRKVCIWTTSSSENTQTSFTKSLGGHRDSVTTLRFRHGTHDLFSSSFDRTLKLFDISQLSYVETFFGHQEEVTSIDILRGEVAVSAGARDRTCRWWKVREESQLVFRGGAKSKVRDVLEGGDAMDQDQDDTDQTSTRDRKQLIEGSIDAVAMIDEHTFLSGGDTGTISLWSLSKKKPIFTVSAAHGFHPAPEGTSETPRWITSLACLPYGDVFASGSWDGQIRLWKLSPSLKSFSVLSEIPALGFVNSLQLIHPSRSIMKRRGGTIIDESQWRRHGGLKGGIKKVFEEEDSDNESMDDESVEEEIHNETTIPTAMQETPLVLIAALGQEPTRGRWYKVKEAGNGTLIVPFTIRTN